MGWFDGPDFETANKIEQIEKGTYRHFSLFSKKSRINFDKKISADERKKSDIRKNFNEKGEKPRLTHHGFFSLIGFLKYDNTGFTTAL